MPWLKGALQNYIKRVVDVILTIGRGFECYDTSSCPCNYKNVFTIPLNKMSLFILNQKQLILTLYYMVYDDKEYKLFNVM